MRLLIPTLLLPAAALAGTGFDGTWKTNMDSLKATGKPLVPAQEYAVFTHRDHISTIRSTWATIWNKWLPESAREVSEAPNFELYGEDSTL
jgi:predicted transcriptional regulator YdeE